MGGGFFAYPEIFSSSLFSLYFFLSKTFASVPCPSYSMRLGEYRQRKHGLHIHKIHNVILKNKNVSEINSV